MSRVVGLSSVATNKGSRVAVIERAAESEYKPIFPADIQALLDKDIYPSLKKFLLFWTMMDTIKVHGYTRASMGAIGRATVGTWWKLAKHDEWGNSATERQRKRLLRFYGNQDREWDNIKDYQNLAYKLMIGAEYLRYFGQVAFLLVRNQVGQPIGFDHLPGLVVPNVDEFGYFKDPAFVQYPTKDPRIRTEFNNPRDILYITNPDWEGSPLGGSDIESLSEYVLPLDLYLQTSAREYMKNSNRPELIYMLPQDISDEAFDTFVALLNGKYGGAQNRGRNPVAVQGELKVERLDDLPDGLPYIEARDDTRDEVLAVTGVSGAVMGMNNNLASANIRESRRQFHETTMEPLFKLLEGGFYEQVHVREFNSPGWEVLFNNPDFLTAVERATVHMRYIQYGVLNPNEAREELGREARKDGDKFAEPPGQGKEPQGSPPEGQEDNPDDPSNTGEPTNDDQDPPRGDQHDDTTGESALAVLGNDDLLFLTEIETENGKVSGPAISAESEEVAQEVADGFHVEVVGRLIEEIRAWRKFAIGRMRKDMKIRAYHTEHIPSEIAELVQERLETAQDVDTVKDIFDDLFQAVEDFEDGENK